MTGIEWREVTATDRPPQNRSLFWHHYFAMNEDDGSFSWDPAGIGVGTYRFGRVKGPSGSFYLPEKNRPKRLQFIRVFWAEIPNRPHDNGLIEPIWRRE